MLDCCLRSSLQDQSVELTLPIFCTPLCSSVLSRLHESYTFVNRFSPCAGIFKGQKHKSHCLLNKRCNISDVAALELSEATKSPNRQRIWRRTNYIAVGSNFTRLSSASVRQQVTSSYLLFLCLKIDINVSLCQPVSSSIRVTREITLF